MKKLLQLLVAVFLFGTCTIASAYSDQSTKIDGADIVSVQRLALAAPLYSVIPGAPSAESLVNVFNVNKKESKRTVLTYEEIVANVQRDKNIDMHKLNRHVSAKMFKDSVAQYADAYVLLTVANNSRTAFFFDVYQAGTNELLYSYQIIAERDDVNDEKLYELMVTKFYKNFDWAIDEQRAQNEKAKKEAARKK